MTFLFECGGCGELIATDPDQEPDRGGCLYTECPLCGAGSYPDYPYPEHAYLAA